MDVRKWNVEELPLRFNLAIRTLTEQVFKQFLVSNSYAALARKDIQAVLDQQEKGFYHVLNFGDFLQDEESYSQRQGKREGRIVTQEVWDTRELHLGVRFRYAEWEIAITFAYDCRYFQPAGIEKLAQAFAGTAKLFTCYEGDRLFGQDVEEQLLFVVRGKLASSMETGDGTKHHHAFLPPAGKTPAAVAAVLSLA